MVRITVQYRAVPCSTVQYRAVPCMTDVRKTPARVWLGVRVSPGQFDGAAAGLRYARITHPDGTSAAHPNTVDLARMNRARGLTCPQLTS